MWENMVGFMKKLSQPILADSVFGMKIHLLHERGKRGHSACHWIINTFSRETGLSPVLQQNAWHFLLEHLTKRLISAQKAWSTAAKVKNCIPPSSSKAGSLPRCLMEAGC